MRYALAVLIVILVSVTDAFAQDIDTEALKISTCRGLGWTNSPSG